MQQVVALHIYRFLVQWLTKLTRLEASAIKLADMGIHVKVDTMKHYMNGIIFLVDAKQLDCNHSITDADPSICYTALVTKLAEARHGMLHTIKGNLKRAACRFIGRNPAYGQKFLWEGVGHSELLFHAVPTQSL